jgi:hypothetical protein
MNKVLHTFPNTAEGLEFAFDLTQSLRRVGFKTRLVERTMGRFDVVTVVATPPVRPSRKERGGVPAR